MKFGCLLYLLSRIASKPLVLRFFGGSFDQEFDAMPRYKRGLLEVALRADGVLFETRQQIEFIRKKLPFVAVDWYANSRPLDSDVEPRTAAEPARRFVFIGHVKPTKGVRQVLSAARDFSNGEIEVDVFGPLQDGMTKAEFCNTSNVHYRGILEPDAVIETLRRYDVALLPSFHHGEGHPGIVLEAYSAGIPVIATRWRALPEIIDDEVTGLLVEPRDTEDLVRAMRRVVESADLMTRLAEGARVQARRFDSRFWTDRFVSMCAAVAATDLGGEQ
jgi:glycosyltransferase involved in cell wall biosynthesis